MNNAQENIEKVVDDYKILFSQEYTAFVKQQQMMREHLLNDFAAVKGDSAIERKLFDVPETLYSMFVSNLNSEELAYFKTKRGGRWFSKKFREFRAPIKL